MYMRRAEASAMLRTALLLLQLWVVLAAIQCSQGRPSWRYISSEVVVPRKEQPRGKGIQTPGWLSYSLSFGGQRHVIRMQSKKLFWAQHLVMVTQDDQGNLQVDNPFVPLDCYYLGYLEEVPFSTVTVDTCYGGLKGIMKLDDLTYEIQPLEDSRRFEHLVSQIVADANAIGPTYMLGHKEERHPLLSQVDTNTASRISSKIYASHRGNMKGCLMSAHSVYTQYNNVTKCATFLIGIGSLVDSMFHGLDLRYYISALVIFNVRDPTTMDNYAVPGSPFHNHYVTHIHTPLQLHSGIITIRDGPHDLAFTPYLYGLCLSTNLVMVGVRSRHYFLLSIIASQFVGRSFGLYYDEQTCVCHRRATCIMYRYPVMTDTFSNCSIQHLGNILFNGISNCVYQTGFVFSNRSLTVARCGNSVVDDREECDCGSFKQCYSNPCCDSSCFFTPGSACDTGRCCTNCSFSSLGTLCRPIQNICDLPEYCRGLSSSCPENVYLQDGTPCTEEGYCYHGNCTDRSMHCKEIFGEGAVNGADICYRLNTVGYRYGQCLTSGATRLRRCNAADAKCGRLQCANVTRLPQLQEHVGFHQSRIDGAPCFGLDLHLGAETTDVGHVRPGTPCDGGRFCVNSTCSGSVAAINYDCHPSKCNLRGICNNRRNCHCHVGWDPPRCIHRGAGGSVDSGPPPRRMRSVRQSDLSVVYLRVVFGRMYAFLAALLFGVATNVRTIKTTTVKEETDAN